MATQDPSAVFSVQELRGYGVKCIVRPTIQIESDGKNPALVVDATFPLDQGGDVQTLEGGTLAIAWVSFCATNGNDYSTAIREVFVALCDASYDPERFTFVPTQAPIINGPFATEFRDFGAGLPVPRDLDGPQLQRLRLRIGTGIGTWTLRVGVVERLDIVR